MSQYQIETDLMYGRRRDPEPPTRADLERALWQFARAYAKTLSPAEQKAAEATTIGSSSREEARELALEFLSGCALMDRRHGVRISSAGASDTGAGGADSGATTDPRKADRAGA